MEPPKYPRLLIIVAAAHLLPACVPPPISDASATIAVSTNDEGSRVNALFRTFAADHGLVVASKTVDVVGPQARRTDAMGRSLQIISVENIVRDGMTVVYFHRGGFTHVLLPADDRKVVELAREFCNLLDADDTVTAINITLGAAQHLEMPPSTDCNFSPAASPMVLSG